jgi:hypothetical protein
VATSRKEGKAMVNRKRKIKRDEKSSQTYDVQQCKDSTIDLRLCNLIGQMKLYPRGDSRKGSRIKVRLQTKRLEWNAIE